MKEMIYQANRIYEILGDGVYKGWHYKIINYGTHPCAYVEIPQEHGLYGVDYIDINIDCHGGLTYSKFDEDGNYYIGWDYAHYGDYAGYEMMFPEICRINGKKWTTEEIFEEVKQVINQLNKEI